MRKLECVKENRNEQEETAAEELSLHIGESVKLHGSIYRIRKMSGFAFVLLRTRKSS